MKGSEIRKLRDCLNLTQSSAAASLGVSERTWQRWEASKKVPTRVALLVHAIAPPRLIDQMRKDL